MDIVEALKWADIWGPFSDGAPDGNALALTALAAEVRRLRAENTHWFDQCHGLRAQLEAAPVAIMDTRDALGICAPIEADFPAIYALQGKRVRLVLADMTQNVKVRRGRDDISTESGGCCPSPRTEG